MADDKKEYLDKDVQLRILECLPGDFDLAQSNLCCVLAYMCDLAGIGSCDYTVHTDKMSYKVSIQKIESMEDKVV